LNSLASGNLSFQASTHDHFTGYNVCFDAAIWANGQAAVRKTELSIHVPVNEKIFASSYFALDSNSLANACGCAR
jgi:hypothetical protein